MLDTINSMPKPRSYLSGQPISKSLELRQEFYQEAIRVYKRCVSYYLVLLIFKGGLQISLLIFLNIELSDLGNTTQELLRLFSTVKSESDIEALQKGTILDDSLPDVQRFLENRVMIMQLYM
jgi:hypothetical protein